MYIEISTVKQNGCVNKMALLRKSFSEDGMVKHRTIASTSRCIDEKILTLSFWGSPCNEKKVVGRLP
jgi:hypothetical protein